MNLDEYKILLPRSVKALKEFKNLFNRRRNQTQKAIDKLKIHPTDITISGIEKLSDNEVGDYSIRVSKGDRIIYDVNLKKKEVILVRAGKHDLYRLIK